MDKSLEAGFAAALNNVGAAANPFWPDYGKVKDQTPEAERIQARFWVDGYVKGLRELATKNL